MEEAFPVNHGSVPIPPSQSSTLLPHQVVMGAYQQVPPTTTAHSVLGPGMRRKKEPKPTCSLKLERILGVTTASSNILASAESHDLIAYAAGAVIVLYNHKRNKQVGFLFRPSENVSATVTSHPAGAANPYMMGTMITPLGQPDTAMMSVCALPMQQERQQKKSTPASNRVKPISCLAFSPDGQYLAAGEMGHQPRILIWSVKDRVLVHQWRAHRFGILSVAFSPKSRYLVSVGFQHDGYLYVWNWRKGIKLASNKVTSKVNALSFAADGSYFVTAGLRHVKYWYFDDQGRLPKKGNLASTEAQVLDGRAGILGALRDCNFVDVACARDGHVYFVTDSGILCLFKEGRSIDKWVNLQVASAYSLQVSSTYVICAADHGIVRLFEPVTLKYHGMLPKPHPLGVDISKITSPDMLLMHGQQQKGSGTQDDGFYPDAVALAYDESTARLTVVYSDRSIYLWDIHHRDKIGKYRSFIAHSDCVWGVEPYPINDLNTAPTSQHTSMIPPNSFATYSADGTVRFWNLDMLDASPSGTWRKNIYAKELVKMVYVDTDAAEFAKVKGDIELTEDQCPDFGIRSLKIKKDGTLLATGDRSGNLRVHDMTTWEQITFQEAHDSEVLSIDISQSLDASKPCFLATGSRDRFIHVFDVRRDFELVQSLDDHSSSITSVRFADNADKLISCGADKGIIFRQLYAPGAETLALGGPEASSYVNYHNHSGRSSVFDMALDVSNRFAAAVTGERRLFVFNIASGKPFLTCKPETTEEINSGQSTENSGGSLINIDLDPFSGTFAVTSGSDRCLRLFDLASGQCIDKVCAHAELITSVKFIVGMAQRLRVISTSSDGTVFVWTVGKDLVVKMKTRAAERDQKLKRAMVLGQWTDPAVQSDDASLLASLAAMAGNQNALANASNLAKQRVNGNLPSAAAAAAPPQATPRLRRVSTASVVAKPTLSQMIRQGERRTFSTVSPAEQKYDDLYKKARKPATAETGLVGAASTTPGSSPRHHQHQHHHHPTPHSPTTATSSQQHQQQHQQQMATTRISDKDKLQRLYNGLPTSGAVSARSAAASSTRQSPPIQIGQRITPALRKKFSRDAFTNSSLAHAKPRSRASYDAIAQSSKQQRSPLYSLEMHQYASDTGLVTAQSSNPPNNTPKSPSSAQVPSASPTLDDDNNDDDEDDDELDDEERVAADTSDEIIFLQPAPELDTIGTPVMASSYEKAAQDSNSTSTTSSNNSLSSHLSSSSDENHPKTPTTTTTNTATAAQIDERRDQEQAAQGEQDDDDDDENEDTSDDACVSERRKLRRASRPAAIDIQRNQDEEEEDSDTQEDEDEALLQAILLREPPRMTTTLSRTTSSASPITAQHHQRRSMDLLDSATHSIDAMSCWSAPLTSSPSAATPIKQSSVLWKLQRKLTNSKKRQSFTARFLNTFGGNEKKHHYRESLDNVLTSFKELGKKKEETPIATTTTTTTTIEKTTTLPPPPPPPPPPHTYIHPRASQDTTASSSFAASDHTTTATTASASPSPAATTTQLHQNDHTNEDDHQAVLADLEGAKVLLDSVLHAYKRAANSRQSAQWRKQLEASLNDMATAITDAIPPPPKQQQDLQMEKKPDDALQDPKAFAMLDKYSAMLLQMVESKLQA
ncbi:hypothetical protein BC940DRAFT_292857 [Gongronella butleri]|nr:hypothetical protein BC940DRAFT_292857 [Gongronella butleri]